MTCYPILILTHPIHKRSLYPIIYKIDKIEFNKFEINKFDKTRFQYRSIIAPVILNSINRSVTRLT